MDHKHEESKMATYLVRDLNLLRLISRLSSRSGHQEAWKDSPIVKVLSSSLPVN